VLFDFSYLDYHEDKDQLEEEQEEETGEITTNHIF
jgi:hypothetical protein